MKDLSKLPATQEYLDNFKAKTLDIVLKGTSASLSFLPRSGTNGLLNYLLSYQSRLLKTTKVIFLELQENDSYSPIEQITTHLSVQESPKPRILEQLRLECQKGVNFVFVVGNFHLTKTNNNLKLELVELFKLNNAFIKFLLLFPCEMDIYSRRALTGLLGCNVHSYSNLRRLEDINLLVENDKDWFEYELSSELQEAIVNISGGYSALARVILQEVKIGPENLKKLTSLPSVNFIQNIIVQSLEENSIEELKRVILNKKAMPKSEYLMQTGIVKESGVVFSPLFEEYVRKNLISSTAFLTISEKVISRCGVDINDLLNPQEFNVFMKMYENANEVVTREQIAQAMWGSKFEEKYSEWAIDQTISRIRKKLIDHDKKHIQTVKNEGIKLAI